MIKWRLLNKSQRWFTVMLWFIIVISLSGELWVHTLGKSNMLFYHIYILIEYLFLLNIFRLFFNEYLSTKTWQILAIGFTLIWIGNISIDKGWSAFPDYIHTLEAIIILVLVTLWFHKMLKEKTILNPEKTFEFWICTGLLFFFSGNFLLFVFSNFLMTIDMTSYEPIWKIHIVLNLMLYSMYSIAILWVKKTIR